MRAVPVFYATTEGQTHRIAERLAATLRAAGFDSQALEVGSSAAASFDWTTAGGAVLAASLHAGSHQDAAVRFARAHAPQLTTVPSLFVSVSLSAASAHEQERHAAAQLAEALPTGTGWIPWRVACVAGALAYTKYSFLKRWLMRRIARKEGGPTDTSRDHELTDWAAVVALATDLAGEVRSRTRAAASSVLPTHPAA